MPLWARICLDAHRSAEYRLARERSSPLHRKAADTLEVSNPMRAVHGPENGELPPSSGASGDLGNLPPQLRIVNFEDGFPTLVAPTHHPNLLPFKDRRRAFLHCVHRLLL